MPCKPVCRLCNRLVFSQSIEFTGGNLVVNLPAGSYENGEKYCVVLSQTIPETTTIVAPVVFTIGSGTTQYPRSPHVASVPGPNTLSVSLLPQPEARSVCWALPAAPPATT